MTNGFCLDQKQWKPTGTKQIWPVDRTNTSKENDGCCRKVWRGQITYLIHAKFGRINENNKYINQSTSNWPVGQHKRARLLPKKIFREPFGLPKLEIRSPRYISRSPRLFSPIQTISYETYSLDWKFVVTPAGGGGGGGDSNIKKVGMLVENFEIDPYGGPIWAWLAHFFLLLKETNMGVAPAFFDR